MASVFHLAVRSAYSVENTGCDPYSVQLKFGHWKLDMRLGIGKRFGRAGFLACTFLLWATPSQSQEGRAIAVVAHSISTNMHAKEILREKRWHAADLDSADAVLVVVRSELSYPLDYCYDDFQKLSDDADGQLNISGSNFVVYLYSNKEEQPTCQLSSARYPAND